MSTETFCGPVDHEQGFAAIYGQRCQSFIQEINEGSSAGELMEASAEISQCKQLTTMGRGLLARELQERLKQLGFPTPLREIKRLLRPEPIMGWDRNWVYIGVSENFLNMQSGRLVSRRTFNAMHNQDLVELGIKIPAAQYALEIERIRVVDYAINDSASPAFFQHKGRSIANRFWMTERKISGGQ